MISPQEAQIIYDACSRKAMNDEILHSTKVLAESATHVRVQAMYRNGHTYSIRTFDIEVAQGEDINE